MTEQQYPEPTVGALIFIREYLKHKVG